MFRHLSPEERLAADALNAEQSAAAIAHRLNSPMVSEQFRQALRESEAKAATFAAQQKTAWEAKELAAKQRVALVDLCTNPKYSGPNELYQYAVSQASRPFKGLTEAEIQNFFMTAVVDAQVELDTTFTDKEFARIRAFLMCKELSLFDADNIALAFTILCQEGGLRLTVVATVAAVVVETIAAPVEEPNPFRYDDNPRSEHAQFEMARYQKAKATELAQSPFATAFQGLGFAEV